MREIRIFENSYSLACDLLKRFSEIARKAIGDHDQFNVALSGGRTPIKFYHQLSTLKDYPWWPKTHLFFSDERFVPLDHQESNFGTIKKNLIDHIPIPKGNVHPIRTDVKNVTIAAEYFKDELVGHFAYQRKSLPNFDLILLGIGEDGHTASLFPNMRHTADANIITLPVSLPQLKYDRISLSLSVLNNARYVIFLIQGNQKAGIIHRILNKNLICPARQVNPTSGELIFLLDKEAARKLSHPISLPGRNDRIPQVFHCLE